MRWANAMVAVLCGCTCEQPRADGVPAPPMAHHHEWDVLVERVLARDVEGARVIARDLAGADADGSAELGGALGFLQVAEADELALGLAAAAEACGGCHRDIGLGPTERTPWSHARAAQILVGRAVAGDLAGPPSDDPVAAAWHADTDGSRLGAVLDACESCHGEGSNGAGPGSPVVAPGTALRGPARIR